MPKPTIKTDIGIRNTILSRLDAHASVTVVISSAGVTVDAQGKKIVKAGTFLGPVTSGKSIMRDGVAAKPVNGAETQGLLFHDVDVTLGDMEAAMLYHGTVGIDRIPAAPAAGVNLPRVTFTKD